MLKITDLDNNELGEIDEQALLDILHLSMVELNRLVVKGVDSDYYDVVMKCSAEIVSSITKYYELHPEEFNA